MREDSDGGHERRQGSIRMGWTQDIKSMEVHGAWILAVMRAMFWKWQIHDDGGYLLKR